MNKMQMYGIKNLYKGTFLSYVDEDYIDSGNFNAYISIPDLILTNPSDVILTESIKTVNIKNKSDLNISNEVKSINSIICKPLYINNIIPIVSKNEEVFVFIFDNDPKKIFYALIGTEMLEDKRCKFMLRIGHSLLYIDKDEIRLVHELPDPKSDNSITVSEHGIEFVGENIIVNGMNLGDLTNQMNLMINSLSLDSETKNEDNHFGVETVLL